MQKKKKVNRKKKSKKISGGNPKKPVSSGKSALKSRGPKTVSARKPAEARRPGGRGRKRGRIKTSKTRKQRVVKENLQAVSNPGILEKKWVAVVCIVFLSLIIYSNTFRNGFMYDDTAFITENDSIRSLDNPGRFFTSIKSFSAKGNFFIYRPLATLAFAVDYGLWGLNPKQFHIQNILFHVLNGILVYLLMNILVKHRLASLVTALVFVSHPVQTESVTWIAGRSNLMFSAFWLTALISYARFHKVKGLKRIKYLLISLGAYAFGLLSKEMAVTLPVILILYDFCSADKKSFKTVFANARYYLLFGIVTGGYLYLRYSVLGRMSGQNEYIGGSLSSAFLTMSRGLTHYIQLLIYPVRLSAIYVFSVSSSLLETPVIFSLAILLLLLILTVILFRKSRTASFAIIWFFVTLFPVCNIIPLQDVTIAERFLYLPAVGFCILLGLLSMKVFDIRNKETKRSAGVLFVILLIIFFSLRTISRNADWKDENSFWKATAETAPNSYRVHNSLGYLYMKSDINRAIKSFERSLELNPDNARAHNNLAIAYAEKGWYEKAIKKFKDVLVTDPNDSSTRSNLGLAYVKIGFYNNAVKECRRAVKLNPANDIAYNNLGLAYEKKKNYSEALNQFRIAVEKNQGNLNARANYARVFKILNERKMNIY